MGERSQKLLIVEDEVISAMVVQDTLEREGYTVVAIAVTGREAISMAAEFRPDLILMDIKLRGDLNGIEAATEIQSRSPTKIIYLTAHNSGEMKKKAGVTDDLFWVTKPISEVEFLSKINRVLTG